MSYPSLSATASDLATGLIELPTGLIELPTSCIGTSTNAFQHRTGALAILRTDTSNIFFLFTIGEVQLNKR